MTTAAVLALAAGGLVAVPASAEVVTDLAPDEGNISVRVGDQRTGLGLQEVSGLSGVTLGAFTSSDASGSPVATCVSDVDGDCNLVVGGLTAAPSQFWVAQVATPAGFVANPSLRTGAGNGSGSIDDPYVFPVSVAAGQVLRSTSDFMYQAVSSGADQVASNGIWQTSRENPPLPTNCGYTVAVVLDLSASLGSRITQLKAATDAFVDALVGTPSAVAVFSFDGASPASGGANLPTPLPVRTPAEATAVKAGYADWTTGSGTNWDQAFWAVSQAMATEAYDVVITITDGNPTRFGAGQGTGGTTHFADVEPGIFSANAVKAGGARSIIMGVGSNLDETSELNLKALSGPVEYDSVAHNLEAADYYRLAEFSEAGSALQGLAVAGCEQRLTVTKQIVPSSTSGEDITGATLAGAGWQFAAGTSTAGATITDPVGGLATTTADGTGSVTYQLALTGVATADVVVTETQQAGYDLVTQGGVNAVCVDRSAGNAALVVANAGATGFSVSVGQDSFVQCRIYNREPPAASVSVAKQWRINGELIPNGFQPAGLSADLVLSEPDAVDPANTLTAQLWGTARPQYAEQETVRFDETTTITDPACRQDSATITEINGQDVSIPLPAGGYSADLVTTADSYTLTNDVTCTVVDAVRPPVSSTGGLPVTGSSLTVLSSVAAVLLLFGAGTLWLVRRRPLRGR